MTPPRKIRRPKLTMKRVAHKRHSYAERTKQTGRVAKILTAAPAEHHYTHADIRGAILRQCAVELDDLRAELPDAGISYAITKGWLHRSAGEGFFRVTLRAAQELELPPKNAAGQKIRFADGSSPSLGIVDPPKPVAETRAAALVASLLVFSGDLIAEAKAYQAALAETRWAPAEIARRLGGADRKLISKFWNRAIWLQLLLTLEPEYQAAARAGQVSLPMVGELCRVEGAARAALFATIQAGASFAAVRRQALAG